MNWLHPQAQHYVIYLKKKLETINCNNVNFKYGKLCSNTLVAYTIKRIFYVQISEINSASIFNQVCYSLLSKENVCQTASLQHKTVLRFSCSTVQLEMKHTSIFKLSFHEFTDEMCDTEGMVIFSIIAKTFFGQIIDVEQSNQTIPFTSVKLYKHVNTRVNKRFRTLWIIL